MAITLTSDLGAFCIQGHFCNSLDAVSSSDWSILFPGKGEDWAYFRTLEAVPPPGFRLGAIVVKDKGTVVGVAPVFKTVYRFDTSLQGHLRRIGDQVYQHAPRLISMQVLSLGSPLSDNCHIGIAPDLSGDQRLAVIREILKLSQEAGQERGYSSTFSQELTRRGGRRVREGVRLVRVRARHHHTQRHPRSALSRSGRISGKPARKDQFISPTQMAVRWKSADRAQDVDRRRQG